MTALFIIIGVLVFLLVLILLPVSVKIKYDGEFLLKVKYAGITVYNSGAKNKKPEEKTTGNGETGEREEKEENKFKKYFKEEKEKLGTKNFIVTYAETAKQVLKEFLWFLKKVRFKIFSFNLTVAADNAYDTAIQYGEVCTAVYPVLSFICSNARVKLKQFNINSDFLKTDYEFSAQVSASVNVVFILAAGVSFYKIYLSLKNKVNEAETKEGEKNDE